MYFDSTMLLMIPAILIAMAAQIKVSSTFRKYLKINSDNGYTGRDVARTILDRSGLSNIPIEMVEGDMTDHYDPVRKVVRLSRNVYAGNSISSVSVAAHEVGHAMQHHEGYIPLNIRSALAPAAGFSSQFVWILVLAGIFLQATSLIQIGIVLFLVTLFFQIVTLPVEFNASKRALAQLEQGFLTMNEIDDSKKVLSAAAMTYVAATLVSIVELIRLILIGRNND